MLNSVQMQSQSLSGISVSILHGPVHRQLCTTRGADLTRRRILGLQNTSKRKDGSILYWFKFLYFFFCVASTYFTYRPWKKESYLTLAGGNRSPCSTYCKVSLEGSFSPLTFVSLPLMRMASPSMIGPPSYVVAQDAGTEAVSGGDSAATTASTIIATTKPILDASSTRKAAPPVPHFDSVLRAAPALDDDFDLEEIAESASSSTLSLPDQLTASEGSSLQTLLRPHIEHHASLHAYLDANSMLQEFILQTRESIHIDAGKVKSSHSKVSRLEKDLGSVRLEAEKKGKLFWSPKRRREWRRRMAEVSTYAGQTYSTRLLI
jgi:hypothetical protein